MGRRSCLAILVIGAALAAAVPVWTQVRRLPDSPGTWKPWQPLVVGLSARQAQAATPKAVQAKAAIVVWLSGGPSHIDTWDPKPDAPVEWRGEFSAIGTKAGYQLNQYLPKLDAMNDKFSLLRSLNHPEGAHERGHTYSLPA